jgi:hypothetical protein
MAQAVNRSVRFWCHRGGFNISSAANCTTARTRHALPRGRCLATNRQPSVSIAHLVSTMFVGIAAAGARTGIRSIATATTIESLRSRVESREPERGPGKRFRPFRASRTELSPGSLVVPPFNGRLSRRHAPHRRIVRLDDGVVARALLALSTTTSGRQRTRQTLSRSRPRAARGAVYESVLDLRARHRR